MNEEYLIDALRSALDEFPETDRYWVAYSGGSDSHVLLHAMARHGATLGGAELRAAHVNHGLQHEAPEWAAHCERICHDLGVPLTVLVANASPERGESPEAAARRARYDALAGVIGEGDMLLTAHHQDDQAETFLLQALRGAGPHGLAAMPGCACFGRGRHGRPLLAVSRRAIAEYLRREGLASIQDPSNADTRYDRNFLRQVILPRLRERWPSAGRTLGRAARHQAEAARLADDLAASDLANIRGEAPGTLSCESLAALAPERARNALRYWLRSLRLPVPAAVHLERVIDEVIGAAPDAMPLVSWPGGEVRRYRRSLHAMAPRAPIAQNAPRQWNMRGMLELPHGRLDATLQPGAGLKRSIDRVDIRYRRGGESCRPAGRGHRHSLRKLFQERGVAPWVRDRIPLLFVDGQLAAVPGLCVCEPFQCEPNELGRTVHWTEHV